MSSGVLGSALPHEFSCNEYQSVRLESYFSVLSQPVKKRFCFLECHKGMVWANSPAVESLCDSGGLWSAIIFVACFSASDSAQPQCLPTI